MFPFYLSQNLELHPLIDTFESFSKCAGLVVNLDKTVAKYIGPWKDWDYYPHGLSWTKDPINTLGVLCTLSDEENYTHNFKPRITKLQNTLQIWKQRNLSLKGKITIVNSLAISPLVYVSSVKSTPEKVLKEVRDILSDFMWSGKRPKIAREVLTLNIADGGLKLCNYDVKVKALLLSWVDRLTGDNVDARWKIIPKHFYKTNNLTQFFVSKQTKYKCDSNIPKFYSDIYNAWVEIYGIEPTTIKEIHNEILWNNMYITIGGKPINWREWSIHNINQIRDLLDDNGQFYSHTDLQNKFHIKCNFLQILQLRQSIPSAWRNKIHESNKKSEKNLTIAVHLNTSTLVKNIRLLKCKDYYWHIINQSKTIPRCIQKWQETYPKFENVDKHVWHRIFNMAFITTRETKLQSFQYRIIHRIIPCNKWLNNITVKETDLCDYCTEQDSIVHFLIECEKAHEFWKSLFFWWNRTNEVIIMEEKELNECILFGFPYDDDYFVVLNYVILQSKYYIYKQKLFKENKIDFYDFLKQLRYTLTVGKIICAKENRDHKFTKFEIIHNSL